MSNFLRSLSTNWKLTFAVSSIGFSLLFYNKHCHYASSYSCQLKRYSALAEYPQLDKHSNLMAQQLTPQVIVMNF